jgi:hypothetical protein
MDSLLTEAGDTLTTEDDTTLLLESASEEIYAASLGQQNHPSTLRRQRSLGVR